ncbi:MAG: hypothetical protein AAGA60_27295 [Cyanobacteria bacterium P01_E01_bin.42]
MAPDTRDRQIRVNVAMASISRRETFSRSLGLHGHRRSQTFPFLSITQSPRFGKKFRRLRFVS